jgi:GNAT superfamily N-acetyltransferase
MTGPAAPAEVGSSHPAERAAVLAVARRTGVFTSEEIDTVGELFDGYLAGPQTSGYNFVSARAGGSDTLLGFACWGPTSLSRGAADLYWIATDPSAQGQGVAAALFGAVESAVRAAGRWLIVIWTSSRPEYAPARAFYQRVGAELAVRLTDFYDRGDDLCVFVRRL